MSEILLLHKQYREYCHIFKNLSSTTLRNEKFVLSQYARRTNLEHPSEISKEQIEAYIRESKYERNWSARTILNLINTLRAFLNWCVDQEILRANVALEVPRPKLPINNPKSLTREEAQRLLEWPLAAKFKYEYERKRAIAILGVFLFTGLRRQELLNLRISDIDLDQKTLFVECGKGYKDRLIPLNPVLARILTQYLEDRVAYGKTTPYLFATLRQDKRMGLMAIRRLFIRVQNESGVHAYPHLLRNTFATLMAESGCETIALSKLMGHSDIKTTLIYVHTSTRHKRVHIDNHPLGFKRAA